MIRNFTEKGDNIDVRELEDSRFYIHSKAIKEEIGKIDSIMRWREKIAKKLEDGRAPLFACEEEVFLSQLERDLGGFEAGGGSSVKEQYLEYSKRHDHSIKRILNLITN
jgi:hypothetical protein